MTFKSRDYYFDDIINSGRFKFTYDFRVRINFIPSLIKKYTYYVLNIQIGYNVSTCYVMGLGFVIVISLCSRYYVNTNIKRALLYACYCIDYST